MKTQDKKKGFWGDFRQFFFRGLAAVLPSLLTLVLIIKGYQFINEYIGKYVNRAIIWLVANVQSLIFGGTVKDRVASLTLLWQEWFLHVCGFVIAICLIYFVGVFLASFVGRWLWRLLEKVLNRTPLVRQVYPQIKQVTDFFLTGDRLSFSQVVAVEYPRKGIWSLGLVTGQAPKSLADALGGEVLSIFMPSSPTPLTGYVICVQRRDVIELSISIDDTFRFIISGGVLKPGSQLIGSHSAGPAELSSEPKVPKPCSE